MPLDVMSLLAGEADAKLVISSLLQNIITNKNSRRLQTLSIRHCVNQRLRNAFNALRLLLTPRKRQTVKDWYRRQVISKVFGCWLIYLSDERAINHQLSIKSLSFYRKASLKRFRLNSEKRNFFLIRSNRKLTLAGNYYSYLQLLNSFEVLQERIAKNVHYRIKYAAATQQQQRKHTTNYLGQLYGFPEISFSANVLLLMKEQ